MDGLLVIDKPAGPTSHDVVARIRRVLRERRVGHTGTLDPAATGVLPLVLGRATRLARFLSADDKRYRAVVRLGVRTDSGDAQGVPLGPPFRGELPGIEVVEAALSSFTGSYLQQPPAFSAKKIAGRRSYEMARRSRGAAGEHADTAGGEPRASAAPVRVTVHRLSVAALECDRLTLDVDCSAGFYVRTLADDLGRRLGVGAHLVELRRTRHGELTLAHAVGLEEVERAPQRADKAVIPLREMLSSLAAVTLTPAGVDSAVHGRELKPESWSAAVAARTPAAPRLVRLLSPTGDLVGIGRPSGAAGVLHPFVVLM